MPYISDGRRHEVREKGAFTGGELAFLILEATRHFIQKRDLASSTGAGYDDFAAALAAIKCAEYEFYLNDVRPYEDKKRNENGDVT